MTSPNVNKLSPYQQKWVDALRSGKYKQCKEYLKSEDLGGQTSYCCLGVATELFDPDAHGLKLGLSNTGTGKMVSISDIASEKTVCELNLIDSTGSIEQPNAHYHESLAYMNDQGASFEEIANFIEQNPQSVFKPGDE